MKEKRKILRFSLALFLFIVCQIAIAHYCVGNYATPEQEEQEPVAFMEHR